MPQHQRVYISAESDQFTTISGPPSSLARLFDNSGSFASTSRVLLPITAAFHASHLSKPDIANQILHLSCLQNRPLRPQNIIYSPNTGRPYDCDSLHDVLQEVISDILQTPIRWGPLVEGVSSTVCHSPVRLLTVGPPGGTSLLVEGLSSRGIQFTKMHRDQEDRLGDTSSRSEAIAIIGMSGRFPGGQNLEEFWETLEAGEDTHKEVCEQQLHRIVPGYKND